MTDELSEAVENWMCGCGWINGFNLAVCARCGRTPNEGHAVIRSDFLAAKDKELAEWKLVVQNLTAEFAADCANKDAEIEELKAEIRDLKREKPSSKGWTA